MTAASESFPASIGTGPDASTPRAADPGDGPAKFPAGSALRDGPLPDGDDADLLERMVQGAHETIDRLAETAAPHVRRLQDGVAAAGETLQMRAGQVREVGDEWTQSLRSTVREHPLAAVATALALGVLIARLTQR